MYLCMIVCVCESVYADTDFICTYTRIYTYFLLTDWLADRPSKEAVTLNIESFPKKELAYLLERFYPSVQTKSGSVYAKQTLVNIRSGLNRYLTMPPFNYDWNLMSDKEFKQANKILTGVQRKNRKEGLDKSRRKPTLSPEDLNEIYENYFEPNFEHDPTCLQLKVYFEIVYYLARRGNEGLQELTKDSFEIKTIEKRGKGESGEYLQMTFNECTKKCQGEEYNPHPDRNIILAHAGSRRCPLHSYKLYLSKLSPKSNILFQRPNPRFHKKEGQPWYLPEGVGINTMANFMATISKRANLKTRYTNHCLRGTAATAMKRQGYSIPEIASVTKHKNHQSLEHYLEIPTLEEKVKFCKSLFNYTRPQDDQCEDIPNSTQDCCFSDDNQDDSVMESTAAENMEDAQSAHDNYHTTTSDSHSAHESPDISDVSNHHQSSETGENSGTVVCLTQGGGGNSPMQGHTNTPCPSEVSQVSQFYQSQADLEMVSRKFVDPSSGVFVGAQLSNCTIHVNLSK